MADLQRKLVVKYYYVSWCDDCDRVEPMLEAAIKEYGGEVVLEKIDVGDQTSKISPRFVLPEGMIGKSIPEIHVEWGDRPRSKIAFRADGDDCNKAFILHALRNPEGFLKKSNNQSSDFPLLNMV